MTNLRNTDFLLEVRKGNIPGHTTFPIIGKSTTVGTSFTDIWDEGGVQTDITSAETWEILSSSTDDDGSPAGIGAHTVVVTSLDGDFLDQTTVVTMNGTTPVTIANTHIATKLSVVTASGSNGTNVGDITIRVSGGGDVRYKILADEGVSNNSQFTIPAGKTMLATLIAVFAPKGEDAIIRTRSRPFSATSAEFSPGEFPVYQGITNFDVLASPSAFAAKGLLKLQAKSTNSNITISTLFSILLIDD